MFLIVKGKGGGGKTCPIKTLHMKDKLQYDFFILRKLAKVVRMVNIINTLVQAGQNLL